MADTGLGGVMKQGPFSNWVSQQSLFRMGETQRWAGEVIGMKAVFRKKSNFATLV